MRAQPIWFGPRQRQLFAWHYAPDDGLARATIVLCAPIGGEASNARPALRSLCEHLADAGFAAIRLDYDGTGDSAGAWGDPGRLDAWRNSVRHAVEFARGSGTSRCALVGMRMGALLALDATEVLQDLSAIVLWDPCVSGRAFLREQRLLAAASSATRQRDDGSVEGPGFVFDKECATALKKFSPTRSPGTTLPPALLLERETPMAHDAFDTMPRKSTLDRVTVLGQQELLDVPPDLIVVPEAAIDQIVGWLSVAIGDEAVRLDTELGSRSTELLSLNGQNVTERAVSLGPTALFGIHSFLADTDTQPTVVFLNAGVLEHSGPGRVWTEMARELASWGLSSVRIDFSGIGDSGVRPGQRRHVLNAATEIDDIIDIAVALGSPDGSGLVLVGLSSGGYVAVEAALRLYIDAICTINPVFAAPVAESGTGRFDPRRRAYRPLPRALRPFAIKHKRIAESIWKASAQLYVRSSPAGPIVRAARRGTTVLLVVNEHDVKEVTGHGYWWLMRRYATSRRTFTMHVLPGDDHSLYTRESRDAATATVVSWLRDRYVKP